MDLRKIFRLESVRGCPLTWSISFSSNFSAPFRSQANRRPAPPGAYRLLARLGSHNLHRSRESLAGRMMDMVNRQRGTRGGFLKFRTWQRIGKRSSMVLT